ncbi:hypothetical protein Q9Q99_11205 [Curtobacterium flaccumfaciens]|nr:hypothetical protein Q9Q99_11205 [Curtobacterium flaccumfaciens]
MAVELSTWDTQGNQTTPTFSTMRFPAGEAHVKVANDTTEPGASPRSRPCAARTATT